MQGYKYYAPTHQTKWINPENMNQCHVDLPRAINLVTISAFLTDDIFLSSVQLVLCLLFTGWHISFQKSTSADRRKRRRCTRWNLWSIFGCDYDYYPDTPIHTHMLEILIPCGLVTPYSSIDRGQHWLAAPSHYLNQHWFLSSEVLRHSPEINFIARSQATTLYNEF